jgi:alkylresorcinol/alkylpyrone synthase
VVSQDDVKRLAQRLFPVSIAASPRALEVFDNAEIERRHLCVSLEWLGERHPLGERNDLYIENAARLAAQVARSSLDRAGLTPRDVDHIVFVSSTGLATPSIDALLANQLDCRADVRRTPIWGLGCAGGAAGLSRARDFALADPSARVLLVALELCSFTFQPDDDSKRNLVAMAIFADGAAAAVIEGSSAVPRTPVSKRPLEIVASQSVLWKDTLDVMGWSIHGDGLHVVFSRDIPSIVRESVRPSLVSFLGRHGLSLADVQHLVAHPGGVKVLRAYADALEIAPERLHHARDVLRAYGNMSSPSCLFVLERFLAAGDIGPGQRALVTALGPGFSAEYVLLQGAA